MVKAGGQRNKHLLLTALEVLDPHLNHTGQSHVYLRHHKDLVLRLGHHPFKITHDQHTSIPTMNIRIKVTNVPS